MLEKKSVRKPYEGKPHVRFEEGGRGVCLYSTRDAMALIVPTLKNRANPSGRFVHNIGKLQVFGGME